MKEDVRTEIFIRKNIMDKNRISNLISFINVMKMQRDIKRKKAI